MKVLRSLSTRVRVALVAAAALLGVAAGTAAVHHGYNSGGSTTTDQCSVPVAQRVGGWTCP